MEEREERERERRERGERDDMNDDNYCYYHQDIHGNSTGNNNHTDGTD